MHAASTWTRDGRLGPGAPAAATARLGAGVAAALLCLVVTLVGAHAEDRLRIITSGNYPPFVYTDSSGAFAGFEIDLTNAICAVIAIRCEFTDTPFEEAI